MYISSLQFIGFTYDTKCILTRIIVFSNDKKSRKTPFLLRYRHHFNVFITNILNISISPQLCSVKIFQLWTTFLASTTLPSGACLIN